MFVIKNISVVILVLGFIFSSMAEEKNIDNEFKVINDSDKENLITKEYLEKSFNLDKEEISDFMIKVLNRFSSRQNRKGGCRAMYNINSVAPRKGILWLIKNYENFTPTGKANMIESLGGIEYVEVYNLIFSFLDCNQEINDLEEGRRVIDPFQLGIKKMRICDYAYNTLFNKIWISPKNLSYSIEKIKSLGFRPSFIYSTPIVDRNKDIERLKNWWQKHSAEILKNKKHLFEDGEEFKKKLKKLEEQIQQKNK